MSFFRLVRREMEGSLPRLGVMSALGGLSTAAILGSLNTGAQHAEAGRADIWSALLFLVAVVLFIKTQHYLLIATTAESEAIIHRLRVRILDQVRQSELSAIEEIGRTEIIATITEGAATLTQAASSLAFMVQSLVLIVFVAIYVAFLSIAAFILSVVIIGVAVIVNQVQSRERVEAMAQAATWERQLMARMNDILDGFKEVRLNRARSRDLIEDVREVSRRAANIRILAQSENLRQLVFSQSAMYVLLGAIVFVVPTFSASVDPGSITKNTMAVLFVVGACYSVMQTVTMMTMADAAAQRLEDLENRLRATVVAADPIAEADQPPFSTIEMRNVSFRYPARSTEPGFEIGPLDLALKAGELVFVTGGNGSGKSTFLKVLAGLYAPNSGEIKLDGVPVDDRSRDAYRSLMSAIFTDGHLFDRLFGITLSSQDEVDVLLRKYGLDQKTTVREGGFSTLDLSGGQAKRLALLVGLLEKRQILLLDEWTANQDPYFRGRFYEEILPDLKQAGLTIVVVTHDDLYLERFKLPARRLRMDKGRLVQTESTETVQ